MIVIRCVEEATEEHGGQVGPHHQYFAAINVDYLSIKTNNKPNRANFASPSEFMPS